MSIAFDFLVSRLAMANFGRKPILVVLLAAAFLSELAVVVVLVVAPVLGVAQPTPAWRIVARLEAICRRRRTGSKDIAMKYRRAWELAASEGARIPV